MYTRRNFLRRTLAVGGTALGFGLLAARCRSGATGTPAKTGEDKKSSSDSSKQSSAATDENDLKKRKQLGYVDETPIAENHCSNCGLYLKPKNGEKQGRCQLFKGPVNDNGYCTYWTAATQ